MRQSVYKSMQMNKKLNTNLYSFSGSASRSYHENKLEESDSEDGYKNVKLKTQHLENNILSTDIEERQQELENNLLVRC